MQKISATYRITTPMFLGGADQQAELRLPSFKGVLRFWWRALAWSRIKDASLLRKEESALFGSSDKQFCQSKVLVRFDRKTAIPTPLSPPEQLKDGAQVVGPGARYLGYGVMEAFSSNPKNTKEAQLTRQCFPGNFEFTVNLLLKPSLNSEQTRELVQAVKVLGVAGGIGSKSRKGYGSLTLLSLNQDDKELWTTPTNAQHVAETIQSILGPKQPSSSQSCECPHEELPDWTAFSPSSRVVVLTAGNNDRTPLALLDRIGRELVRFRSWGRYGKVLGNVDSEQNFKHDHDLMKLASNDRTSHPQRVVFGLPHNYGNQSGLRVSPDDIDFDRRASPLFVHVHQSSPGSPPVGVLTYLPSRFLPEGRDAIDVGGTTIQLDHRGLWHPIHSFFNRMLDPNERKELFGEVREVTHG